MNKKSCCFTPNSPLPQLKEEKHVKPSYAPLHSVFGVSLALAISVQLRGNSPLLSLQLVQSFVAISMCILGVLKLQDIRAFSATFQKYDLLAKWSSLYANCYPFIEITLGLLMIAQLATLPVAISMIFISLTGLVSISNVLFFKKESLHAPVWEGEKVFLLVQFLFLKTA